MVNRTKSTAAKDTRRSYNRSGIALGQRMVAMRPVSDDLQDLHKEKREVCDPQSVFDAQIRLGRLMRARPGDLHEEGDGAQGLGGKVVFDAC